MKNNSKLITNNIEEVFNKFTNKKQIAVAVSGGSDSLALTLALNDYCVKNNIKIFAITIDHKIREKSTDEAKELNIFLKNKFIDHRIIEVPKNMIPKANIESKLRDIRYNLLTEFCKKNDIELLFVGHHIGDVAENFLIRLFRGSGIDGLSLIQEISIVNNIKIIRPFLNIDKKTLQEYLILKNIKWFEDESNEDEKFLRNKIRKFLASFNERKIIENRIYQASKQIEIARDLIDEFRVDIEKEIIYEISKDCYQINIVKLKQINTDIAYRILIILLTKISKKTYKPRKEKFLRFYQILIDNKIHKKYEFNHCVIEKNSEDSVKIYKKI